MYFTLLRFDFRCKPYNEMAAKLNAMVILPSFALSMTMMNVYKYKERIEVWCF